MEFKTKTFGFRDRDETFGLRDRGKVIHLSFETEARHIKSLTRDCLEARQLSRELHH